MPWADKQWQAVKEKILLSRKTSFVLPKTTLLPTRKNIHCKKIYKKKKLQPPLAIWPLHKYLKESRGEKKSLNGCIGSV